MIFNSNQLSTNKVEYNSTGELKLKVHDSRTFLYHHLFIIDILLQTKRSHFSIATITNFTETVDTIDAFIGITSNKNQMNLSLSSSLYNQDTSVGGSCQYQCRTNQIESNHQHSGIKLVTINTIE